MSKCQFCGGILRTRLYQSDGTDYLQSVYCPTCKINAVHVFEVIYQSDETRHKAIIQRELERNHVRPITALGEHISNLRRSLGITYPELARATKLSRTTIWCLERGIHKNPDKSLNRVLEYLNQQLQKGKGNEPLSGD